MDAVTTVAVLEDECEVSAQEWPEHAKGRIAPSAVPETITFPDEVPRNQSGTLYERALRA